MPPVNIKVKMGNVEDPTDNTFILRQIIHQGVVVGLTNLVNDAIALAKIIVPESIASPTRYLRKTPQAKTQYVSERLMQTYIADLQAQLAMATSGAIELKSKYTITQHWDASYAQYVNALPTASTLWSKATSEGGFIQAMDTFLRHFAKNYVNIAINSLLTNQTNKHYQVLIGGTIGK